MFPSLGSSVDPSKFVQSEGGSNCSLAENQFQSRISFSLDFELENGFVAEVVLVKYPIVLVIHRSVIQISDGRLDSCTA